MASLWDSLTALGKAEKEKKEKLLEILNAYFSPSGNKGDNVWNSKAAKALASFQEKTEPAVSPLINLYKEGAPSVQKVSEFTSPLYQVSGALGITKKPEVPTASDVGKSLRLGLAGAGAILAPGGVLAGGVINSALNTASNKIQGKPAGENLTASAGEGLKFGAILGPVSTLAETSLAPLIKFINPVELKNINKYLDLAKNATTPEVKKQFYDLLGKRIVQTVGAKTLAGFAGMGAYGALQPAQTLEERVSNTLSYGEQGALFSGATTLGGYGLQAAGRYTPANRPGFAKLPAESKQAATVEPLGAVERPRGFVESVQKSKNVSDATKAGVTGTYTTKPNSQLMGEAQALLTEGASIKFKDIKNLDQKVAATIQEALNQQKAGNPQVAANLYNNLSEAGTELGRGVQAFNLLDRMSPEAISLSAAGKIKTYNATAARKIPELTGDQQQMISDSVEAIRGMVEGREKNIAIREMQNKINDFIPSSVTDKFLTVWKAGLLTSLRTHERNLAGNLIMQGFETAKDLPATAADKLMSLRTGQRTQTMSLQGLREMGSKATRQQVKDIVTMGYDPEQAVGKFEVKRINWGHNPVEQALKAYTEAVFRTLGAEDKPFFNAAFKRSLYDTASAEAINSGRSGDKAFIESLVHAPTEKMLTTATADANYATFHDTNKISSLASTVKQWSRQSWWTKLGAEVVAPFTGVPSSIAGKTIAYSPVGLLRGIVDTGRVLVSDLPELQRQAGQEIGRGVMGTGLYGLGAYLMAKGLMTGQPKDAKEAAQWQLEGKQANSVLVGGKWLSINSVGPQTLALLAGGKTQQELGPNGGGAGALAAGIAQDQMSQTFLQGVQGPLNAISDPGRYGKNYFGNQMASITPNILKDVSKAFDPYQRETNNLSLNPLNNDYLKATIPGVRNSMLPKRDVLGNTVAQEPSGLAAFYDLFNAKTPIENATVDELKRLGETGNEATPSKLGQDQTVKQQKIKLTFEQLNSLEAGVGEALKPQLEELINSRAYSQLSDEDKSKAIKSLTETVRKDYKTLNVSPDTGELTGKDISSAPSKAEEKLDEYLALKKTDPVAAYTMMSQIKKDIYHPSLYSEIQSVIEERKLGVTKSEKKLKSLNISDRAEAIAKQLVDLPKGSSERATAVLRLRKVGVITDAVYKILLKMQREGKF